MKAQNQLQAIELHLKNFGHITSLDAIREYSITRLSDKIFKLRNKGLNIETLRKKTVNRFGNPVSYGVYTLK